MIIMSGGGMKGRVSRPGGFTLVEMLVVVAIMVIVAALLVSGLSSAKRVMGRTICASNLRQIGVAMASYCGDNNGYYPTAKSWDRDLMSYLGITTTSVAAKVFICPTDTRSLSLKPRSYYVLAYNPSGGGSSGATGVFSTTTYGGLRANQVTEPARANIVSELFRKEGSPNGSYIDNFQYSGSYAYGTIGKITKSTFCHGQVDPSTVSAYQASGIDNYLFCDGHVESLTGQAASSTFITVRK